MISVLKQKLSELEDSGTAQHLKECLHGIEKEGLRVDSRGSLSLTPHPEQLGSSLTNGSVTTDFSESQLELITPAITSPEESLNYLESVHQFTYAHLGEELMWAGSMPCGIEDESLIPIAQYGSSNQGIMKHIYRLGLKHRYGSMMQSIAGIHYNFSLPLEFWQSLQKQKGNTDSLQSFRSSSYFTMIKNFRRHSWLLLYLFGASPALSKTFLSDKQHCLQELKKDTLFLPYATSLRMSDLGYTTNAQSSLNICFNHLDTYIKSLTDAIHTPYPDYEKIGLQVDGRYKQLATTVLQIENEYYNDIRPKRLPGYNETPLQALQKGGVEYIEVRNTDINPLLPLGLDLQQTLFMDIFLISCLLMGDHIFTQNECNKANDNLKLVTTRGREPGLQLANAKGTISFKDSANQLISKLEETARLLDSLHSTDKFTLSVKAQTKKVEDAAYTPSAKVLNSIEQSQLEYTEWILLQSKAHKKTLLQSPKNEKLLKYLAKEAIASFEKQRELEESDTLEFDDYLRLHRTGVKA